MIVWSPLLSNYLFNLSNGRYCSYWVIKSQGYYNGPSCGFVSNEAKIAIKKFSKVIWVNRGWKI